MKPAAAPHPQLAQLQSLLARHGEAVRDGDGDAVAALGGELRQLLGVLARGAAALRGADRSLLQSLLRQCVQTQAQLARRQHEVERALRALSAAAPQAQSMHRVYGANGTLGAGGWRGNGLGRA